ncbi:MAG: hypothetical protein SFX73_29150 [Kofleriaceae bacterium]|nr:hypothetical protein [Kofleriaceae bacterium]
MRAAFALAMASVLVGCGDDGGGTSTPDAPDVTVDSAPPVDAVPRETIMVSQPLVPGELVEGFITGGPPDYAVITLRAPSPDMDWNIHGHANGGTQIVDEGFKVTTVDEVFTLPSQAKWYLLIRNSGSTDLTVDIKVELFGSLTWEWQ